MFSTIRNKCMPLGALVLAFASCGRPASVPLASATKMLTAQDYRDCIQLLSDIAPGSENERGAHITSAQCAMGIGDYQSATRDYTDALRSDSRSAQLFYFRGAARSQTGDVDGGIADFSQAIEIDPSYGASYAGRASAKCVLDRTDEALADLNDGIQHQPNDAGLYHAPGVFSTMSGPGSGPRQTFSTPPRWTHATKPSPRRGSG